MNRKDRERIANAVKLGRTAALDDKPINANPYKKSLWGVGGFWEIGWRDGQKEKDINANSNNGN